MQTPSRSEPVGYARSASGLGLKRAATAEDERQIRRLAQEWADALAARDLDGLTRLYSPDVVFFDAVPPFSQRGADTYGRRWKTMLANLPPGIGVERREVELTVSGDLAFMHCLARIYDHQTREDATCGWVRMTVIYRRQKRVWHIVHEHVSVPFHPQAVGLVNVTAPVRALLHYSVRCWLDSTRGPQQQRIAPVR
jgi:uncharacterized protein (TIGR02246 family)